MGLVLRQIASQGEQHEYWLWREHKPDGARLDAWGPSDLPRCATCYGSGDTRRSRKALAVPRSSGPTRLG